MYIQWNPLNTKLKGLMKSLHVIYQNFMLSEQLGILNALQG